MANSYNDYTVPSNISTTTVFTSPPYLEGRAATDISVTVAGTALSTSQYAVSGTSILFNQGYLPTIGQSVRVSRQTSRDVRLTDFSDASLLTADALDNDSNQLFYMAQEAVDTASETNLLGTTLYTTGGTNPTTSVVGALFFNTSTKVLAIWDGTNWVGVTTSIDRQTFLGSAMTSSTTYTNYKYFVTPQDINLNTLVFLNGVKLNVTAISLPPTDGTAGTQDYYRGASVTFDNYVYIRSPQDTDVVEVIHLTNTVGGSITSVDGNVSFTSASTTLNIGTLPTSSANLVAGDLYRSGNIVRVVL
tara:strand:+ start:73 stop:984 length:912 start_codon:yes stop_codon:yes gene_type:complete